MQHKRSRGLQLFGFDSQCAREGDDQLTACWLLGRQLEKCVRATPGWHIYCQACAKLVDLESGPDAPFDAREGLCCPHCGLNARIRAAFAALQDLDEGVRDLYVTEQTTAAYVWLQHRYPDVRGSEFEPDDEKRTALGTRLHSLGGSGKVDFEDVTRLSFTDASLDAVVSFDVLEHVPDYERALAEFARVMRPGGMLMATFPFTDTAATIVRAGIDDSGNVFHLLEPEYHGDPIGGGVLCFQHFGWDVLEVTRRAGFAQAHMVMPWAPEQGLFYGLWMLVATR